MSYTSKSKDVIYMKESLISAWKQSKQQARTVNFVGDKLFYEISETLDNYPRKVARKLKAVTFENIYRECSKKTIYLELPNEFLSNKQYQCNICSLNKIIIQNKFHSNCTKMKFVDWGSAF